VFPHVEVGNVDRDLVGLSTPYFSGARTDQGATRDPGG
jgi:hypothetical protein